MFWFRFPTSNTLRIITKNEQFFHSKKRIAMGRSGGGDTWQDYCAGRRWARQDAFGSEAKKKQLTLSLARRPRATGLFFWKHEQTEIDWNRLVESKTRTHHGPAAHGGAARRSGPGRIGRRRVFSRRAQLSLVTTRASKTTVLNISSEERKKKKFLCKL